jgi:acetyl esterase/lipase
MFRYLQAFLFAAGLLLLAAAGAVPGQAPQPTPHGRAVFPDGAPKPTRQQDVVYGRKYGTALTMDVFTPAAKANGVGVIFVVSGGWVSAHEFIDLFGAPVVNQLTGRGYTVFAVLHGCQPKYAIPEILQDMHRAVRYIRHHAKDYKIDPNRLGICGGSAGGHLSLMQGLAPAKGNPAAKDPVEKESSQVQAVACFFPPTDFLNYGKEGENALGKGVLAPYKAAFDFHEFDAKTKVFVPVTDEKKILAIGQQISPVTHVSAAAPPTLIVHGDADTLVPIQQAQILVQKMQAAGATAKLITKAGLGHGWPDQAKDMILLADWFDQHLKP